MATTTTALTPQGRIFPYISLAETQRVYTGIPRSELIFLENTAAITVAAAGALQEVTITCDLPRGFGYVLIEANMNLSFDAILEANDWADVATCQLKDVHPSPKFTAWMEFSNPTTLLLQAASSSSKTYQVINPLQKVVVCDGASPGLDGRFFVRLTNPVIDGIVGSIDFMARFLKFDLNQSYHSAVNTPVPVR
jgi:hypothetical protein